MRDEIKNLAIKAGISNKKYSCLPKFANLLKHESSAEGAGHADQYEDTTEDIKAAQEHNKKKVESHKNNPMKRV